MGMPIKPESLRVYQGGKDVTHLYRVDTQTGTVHAKGPQGGMKVSVEWQRSREEKRPRRRAQWKQERSGFRR